MSTLLVITETPWYVTLSQIVAIPAFLISIWVLLSPYLLPLKIKVLPEDSIQVIEDEFTNIDGKKRGTAFNILFTLIASEPKNKWQTFKFKKAIVSIPQGSTVDFICDTYLAEIGRGQENLSRNVPMPISGTESRVVTVGFQSVELSGWIEGKYDISIIIENSKGKKIASPRVQFELQNKDVIEIRKPRRITTLPSIIIYK